MKLTEKQIDALSRLDQYQGQRVLVLTSEYELGQPRAKGAKGLFNASTLRGLAAKGLIEVEPIWRGAWVTVPKRESLALKYLKSIAKE